MPITLYHLIRASNNAGYYGQSFKNHVQPSTPSTMDQFSINSYRLGNNIGAANFPVNPDSLIIYGQGDTIGEETFSNAEIIFDTIGSNFFRIRNNNFIFYWQNDPSASNPDGSEIIINDVTWFSDRASVNFTARGPYDESTNQSLIAFSVDFQDPAFRAPNVPSGQSGLPVTIIPILTGASSPSGTADMSVRFRYVPDNGPFNSTLIQPAPYVFRIRRRAYPSWNTRYEIVSSTSSDINDIGSRLINNTFTSYPLTELNIYIWYRLRPEYGGSISDPYTQYSVFPVLYTDRRTDE